MSGKGLIDSAIFEKIFIDLKDLKFSLSDLLKGPEKTWSDELVYSYFKNSFTPLPMDKACQLCAVWWPLYNSTGTDFVQETVASVTVSMALHLIDPSKGGSYFMDLIPTEALPTDLEDRSDIASILTTVKENDTPIPNTNFPFVSLAEEPENNTKAINKWFSSLAPRNKVAFTAFVAGTCLRICCKEPEAVRQYISNCSMTDWVKLYRRENNGLNIPAPSSLFIEALALEVKKGSDLCNMAISRYLAVYKCIKDKQSYKAATSILNRIVLNKNSGNGLKLVYLALDAAKSLNVKPEELFETVLKCEQRWDENKVSIDLIRTFLEHVSGSDLWPWCRFLDDDYHYKLQLSKNKYAATIFAGILWPVGDEAGWQIKGLEDVRETQADALEVAKSVRDSMT